MPRKYIKKKGYKKKRNTTNARLKKLERAVAVTAEKAYHDHAPAPMHIGDGNGNNSIDPFDFGNITNQLYPASQGNAAAEIPGNSHRIGDKIVVRNMSLRGVLDVGSSDQYNEVRLILIRVPYMSGSTVPRSAPPLLSDILQDPLTNGINSFYRKNGNIKWIKMIDRTYKLSNKKINVSTNEGFQDHVGINWPPFVRINWSFKFKKGLVVTYPEGTNQPPTANGEHFPDTNRFFLFAISDSSDALITGHPTLKFHTRINYEM
jgi:hypothetical protein